MTRTLSLASLACISALLIACSYKVSETARLPNQTASVDAVTAIRETDATVATPTEVYLVMHGERVLGEPVFRADNVEELSLKWETNTRLEVHAKSARVFLNRTEDMVRSAQGDVAIVVAYSIEDDEN